MMRLWDNRSIMHRSLSAPPFLFIILPPGLAVAKLNQNVGKLAQASRGNQVTSRPNGLFPKNGGEINRVGPRHLLGTARKVWSDKTP